MRISEKAKKMKNEILFDKWSIFCLTPPTKKIKKSKNVKHLILMNVKNNVWYYLLYLRNIIYLVQIMRYLLSNKMYFCIYERSNNSIAKKLHVVLVKNRRTFLKIFLVHDKIQWLNCFVQYLNVKWIKNW